MAMKPIFICDICQNEVDIFAVTGNPIVDLETKAFKTKILIGETTDKLTDQIRAYGLDLVITTFDNGAGKRDICFSCLTIAIVSLGEEMSILNLQNLNQKKP